MRKLFFLFLSLALLAGCSKGPTPSPAPTESEKALIGNVFLDADQKDFVTQGGGMTRVIYVNKADAEAASQDDYKEFLDELLYDARVFWKMELFGMVFEDGTCVTYYGCDPNNAVYGKAGYGGACAEPYGYIQPNDDGSYSYVEYSE